MHVCCVSPKLIVTTSMRRQANISIHQSRFRSLFAYLTVSSQPCNGECPKARELRTGAICIDVITRYIMDCVLVSFKFDAKHILPDSWEAFAAGDGDQYHHNLKSMHRANSNQFALVSSGSTPTCPLNLHTSWPTYFNASSVG